uniref:Uncharacterized protein n=1 Tax=Meloidogyne javanica TaxID=6303 RepID=A0A915N828_MELJA
MRGILSQEDEGIMSQGPGVTDRQSFSVTINGDDVLKMAQCYMNAFYQKPLIPRDDVIPMDEALNPHLVFSGSINYCLNGIEAIKNLHAYLFNESGLKQWRDESHKELQTEYVTKIHKYANLPANRNSLRTFINRIRNTRAKPIIEKWQNGNQEKMREEFFQEFAKVNDASRYNQINNEQAPAQKKIKINDYVNDYMDKYDEWSRITKRTFEKFKNMYLNDMDNKYNRWRRKLSPFSLLLNSAYLKFADVLIGKLIAMQLQHYQNVEVAGTFRNEGHTNSLSPCSIQWYMFRCRIFGAVSKDEVPQFPTIKSVILLVRHGERLDNDKDLKRQVENTPGQQYEYKGRYYNFDNSPLNETGEERALVLNKVIKNLNIKYLFAASYDRTIQTAVNALRDSHKNYNNGELESELKIKIEPGFIESMSDCVDRDVGYLEFDELNEHYERLDSDYEPILQRDGLCSLYQTPEARKSDIGCIERVKYVLNELLRRADLGEIPNAFYAEEYDNEWILPG